MPGRSGGMHGSPRKTFLSISRVIKAAAWVAVVTALTCLFMAEVEAANQGYRWRIDKNGLFASEFEATDAIGRITFTCLSPGVVEITVLARRDQLRPLGDLLAGGVYPKVILEGDHDADFLMTHLSYTELPGGWQYSFYGSINTPAMVRFEQTGTLSFEIVGGIKDGVSLDQGLDAIALFRLNCNRADK